MAGTPGILVGIDLGTTVLKAAAYDTSTGRVRAAAEKTLDIALGPDGQREQDAEAVRQAMWTTLDRLRGRLGKAWARVAGLGLAAQGGSAVIVDRGTGKARTPLYLWNDLRFMPYLGGVQRRKPQLYWRRLAWRDEPGWGLARMLWLRQRNPRVLTGASLYAGAGDLLFGALTGQWRQDAGNALQEGCYRVATERLDAEPLRLVGVDFSRVSALRHGHQTHPLTHDAARRLGLRAGIAVAGPYMDHEAGYMAAMGLARRPLQLSLGTAWVGSFTMAGGATWSSPFQLVVPAPGGGGKLVVQPLLTGNVTWDWALATLGPGRQAFAAVDAVFREALLPAEGLVALPWLNMPNPWAPANLGAGAFLGMSATTSRADLLRAVAAGMVYELRRVFAEVLRARVVDAAILSGGASKGQHFRTLLAAALAPLPVYVMDEEGWSGARGALRALGLVRPGDARRVPAPRRDLREAVERGAAAYAALHERLYGQVAIGGGVRIRGAASPRGRR